MACLAWHRVKKINSRKYLLSAVCLKTILQGGNDAGVLPVAQPPWEEPLTVYNKESRAF
jgi:hypothetical protein